MRIANYKKTFLLQANFEHTVEFKVKARSEEHAKKLVEEFGFAHHNKPEYSYIDGNFGGLLGIYCIEEVETDNKSIRE